MSAPIFGIDLGTTNSVVAVADHTGICRVITDERQRTIHPSVVAFHPNGSVVVGESAKQRRNIDPRNTVYSAKRLIGRRYSSPEVAAARERVPYTIREGDNDQPIIETRAGSFAIPEISAFVLDYMHRIGRSALGLDDRDGPPRLVVTVPANFNDAQRAATATAGSIAGLVTVRVLNEPTAAALAYGHNKKLHQTIAVYDFGGGTFDVSILKLDGTRYEVIGTAGESYLGGEDIDERVLDQIVRRLLEQQRVDPRGQAEPMMRLRTAAEKAKIALSSHETTDVSVREIAYGPGGRPLDFNMQLNRREFTGWVSDLVDRTFLVCEEAFDMTGIRPDQVDDVILVGGSTKIPFVRQRVAEYFRKAPRTDIDPDVAVAVGASLQGAAMVDVQERNAGASASYPSADTTLAEGLDTVVDDDGETTIRRDHVDVIADAIASPGRETDLDFDTPRHSTEDIPTQIAGAPVARVRLEKKAISADSLIATEIRDARGKAGPKASPSEQTLVELPPETRPGAAVPSARRTDRASAAPPPPRAPASHPHVLPSPPPRGRVTRDPAPASNLPTLVEDSVLDTSRGSGPMVDHQGRPVQSVSHPPLPSQAVGGLIPPPPPPLNIVDVTPHSLGIGTVGGFCEPLIQRNSNLPAGTERVFNNSRDGQVEVRIRICQGESPKLADNLILGDLVLSGLPPRVRGRTEIVVTFAIDANGILQVEARDKETGQAQHASLSILGAQSPEEVAAARDRFSTLRNLPVGRL